MTLRELLVDNGLDVSEAPILELDDDLETVVGLPDHYVDRTVCPKISDYLAEPDLGYGAVQAIVRELLVELRDGEAHPSDTDRPSPNLEASSIDGVIATLDERPPPTVLATAPASTGYVDPAAGIDVSIDGVRIKAFPEGLRFTDTDNAERFLHLHRDRVRYVLAWGTWIVWGGALWQRDPKAVLAQELAKDVARHLYAQLASDPGQDKLAGWAQQSANAARIAGMVNLARGMRGIAIDHEDLDADPWALGVANGWINLRDGTFHPPDPAKLMTLAAPVTFDLDATAPRWTKALAEWLPGREVRSYFQRLCGEAIVGTVRDHLLVLIYGEGANGKGTAIDTLRALLGPYFIVPDKSLLTQVKWDRHPTEKAALFRTRLAVAAETEGNVKLAEASVKELTGGDRLSARKMREDPWSFSPTHSMWLQTNHLPEISGTDDGIWRRVRVLRWPEKFDGDREDTTLRETLADELPGILNWIIEGAIAWQNEGLEEPAAVVEASAEYRQDQDQVAQFLDATGYQLGDGLHCESKQLMSDWAQWTEDEYGRPVGGQVLAARIRSLGAIKDSRRPPSWRRIGKPA